MKILIIFVVIVVAVSADVNESFRRAKIVPDIINVPPNDELTVSYGNARVLLGNDLSQADTGSRPDVSYRYRNGEYYTLIMIDPDVFGEKCPLSGDVFMWIVGNIPGDVRRGEEIISYMRPLPLLGTHLHRYTFLLYRQPGKLSFDEKSSAGLDLTNRLFSSVKSFASKYNLGNPIAGNYFTAGFDVPFLREGFVNLIPSLNSLINQ